MIVTPGVVDAFKARSKTISTMRRMLEDQGEWGRGRGTWQGATWGACRCPPVLRGLQGASSAPAHAVGHGREHGRQGVGGAPRSTLAPRDAATRRSWVHVAFCPP